MREQALFVNISLTDAVGVRFLANENEVRVRLCTEAQYAQHMASVKRELKAATNAVCLELDSRFSGITSLVAASAILDPVNWPIVGADVVEFGESENTPSHAWLEAVLQPYGTSAGPAAPPPPINKEQFWAEWPESSVISGPTMLVLDVGCLQKLCGSVFSRRKASCLPTPMC